MTETPRPPVLEYWIPILDRIAAHPERTPSEDMETVNYAIRDALKHIDALTAEVATLAKDRDIWREVALVNAVKEPTKL